MCCYGVLNLIAKHGRLFNRGILFVDKEDTELEKGGLLVMDRWKNGWNGKSVGVVGGMAGESGA